MEASTLKMKKQIKKGKLKKTMKNVICRPDPTFWPQLSEGHTKILEEALNKHKVEIPNYKKPLWSEISQIPKKMRPKPPPSPKVDGLSFGIGECKKIIESKECMGVLIEAGVNPKAIVLPLIELCTDNSVPVLCLKDLRRITKMNYGIATTALGVKQNILLKLETKLIEISKHYRPPKKMMSTVNLEMDICTSVDKKIDNMDTENKCPYLYRTDNKTRVFTPGLGKNEPKLSNKFDGQNFIELSNAIPTERMDRKQYMKMIVKKISSNPNRRKQTKVSLTN